VRGGQVKVREGGAVVKILDIRETTASMASEMSNAYINFRDMTTSVVAIVTDKVRGGKPVIGYGFNSNGRYAVGGRCASASSRASSRPTHANSSMRPGAISTPSAPGGS